MNPSSIRTRLLGLAAISLAATSVAAQSLLPTQGQVVAEDGDAPIGVAAGEVFGTTSPFDAPIMDRNGAILFRGRLAGLSVTPLNDRVICYGHTKDDVFVVARTDFPEPSGLFPNSVCVGVSGSSGLPFTSNTGLTSSQRISPTGNIIMFGAQLYDGGNPGLDGLVHTSAAGTVNNSVLYVGVAGGPMLVAAQRNTTVMPGGAVLSSAFSSFSQQSTALNSSGTAMFKSSLVGGDVSGSGDDSAWITYTLGGSPAYFVREGTEPYLGGAVVQGALGSNCVLNENGQVLHDETLSTSLGTTPATTSDDKVVVVSTPTGPGAWSHTFVMREGDAAPDATGAPLAGITYSSSPTLAQGFTNSGKAAFRSALAGAVTTADDSALFVYDGVSTKMVAREGDVVPDTGGETINVINSTTSHSEAGLLFGTTLIGASTVNDDSALCLAQVGLPLQVIVREGDACPGLTGFSFGRMSGSTNFGSSSAHKINERGRIVFNMPINDGVADVTSSTWSWDPLLGLQLQAMTGDVIGGLTLSSASTPLQFPGGDGSPLGFNNSGDWVAEHNGSVAGPSSSSAIVRGHVGSLQATPSAIPADGSGVPQVMAMDFGPTHAFEIYIVLATAYGTDVGFPNPFNFALNVPLNVTPPLQVDWLQISLDNPNSPIWGSSLGLTDATGKATASFTMPAGFPGFLGTNLHHAAATFSFAPSLFGTYVSEPAPCHLY